MPKTRLLTIASTCVLVMIGTNVVKAEEARACTTNFTTSGSFLAGKNFKTWEEFPSVAQSDAYKKLYALIVSDGWKITASDKDMGMLAAAQEVSYGSGKAAPLNMLVESNGAGSKVTLTFATSGAVAVKAASIQEKFCSYLAAVASSEKKS